MARPTSAALVAALFLPCCSSDPAGTRSAAASASDAGPVFPAPPDVSAPPANASTTPESGLKWVTVRAGSGRPATKKDLALYHITSWSTAGAQLYTSRARSVRPLSSSGEDHVLWRWLSTDPMLLGEVRHIWVPAGGDGPGKSGQHLPPASLVRLGPNSMCELELVELRAPPPETTSKESMLPTSSAVSSPSGRFRYVVTSGKMLDAPSVSILPSAIYACYSSDGARAASSWDDRTKESLLVLFDEYDLWHELFGLMDNGTRVRVWALNGSSFSNSWRGVGVMCDVELLLHSDR